MSTSAQIGVTGLAVMGRNLARNFARNGYTVALHNRTAARTHALVEEFGNEGDFIATETAKEFVAALERPRRLVIMVKAGTDPSRVKLLADAIAHAATSDEFKAYLKEQYADPQSFVPADKVRDYMAGWLEQAHALMAAIPAKK